MGVDNSGKTTLARNIKEALNNQGVEFGYMSPLGAAPLERQIEHLDSVLFSDDNLVIDRLPIIEEEVVGRVLRGVSNFDKINKDKLFQYYQNIDMIIFCNPSMEVVMNWGTRPQMDGVKENAQKLQDAYNKLFFKLVEESIGMPTLFCKYDWKKDVTGRRCHIIVESILRLLKEKEAEA